MRALASHQCVPGSIHGPGVICGLSLLLVLALVPRVFLRVLRFFLPPQKSTFLNSNSIGNSRATGLSVEDCYVLPSLNKGNLIKRTGAFHSTKNFEISGVKLNGTVKIQGKVFENLGIRFECTLGAFHSTKNYRHKFSLVEWNGYDPEFEVTCSATQGMVGETFRGFRAA